MGDGINSRSGECLCGAVSFVVNAPLTKVLHCHCGNCRRITGNFVAASRVANDNLDVVDPDLSLNWHRFPYARYGFCRKCSSTLFFVAEERDDYTSVMLGALDNTDGIPLAEIWFADEAQLHNQPLADVAKFIGNSDSMASD